MGQTEFIISPAEFSMYPTDKFNECNYDLKLENFQMVWVAKQVRCYYFSLETRAKHIGSLMNYSTRVGAKKAGTHDNELGRDHNSWFGQIYNWRAFHQTRRKIFTFDSYRRNHFETGRGYNYLTCGKIKLAATCAAREIDIRHAARMLQPLAKSFTWAIFFT